MIVHHPIRIQVFHADDAVAVYNPSRVLVREVLPLELRSFVNSRDDLAMRTAFRGTFGKCGMLALDALQRLLFTTKETGVLNFFGSGKRGKRFESNIYSYLFGAFWQAFGLALTRKRDSPFVGATLVDGSGFDGPAYRAMIHHLDGTDFGEGDAAIMRDAKARLREGERVIASVPLEARVSRLFTCFDLSKKGLHTQINANRHILQDLGMNDLQRGTLLFQYRIGGLLPVARQTLALVLIRTLALFEQVVIQPSALFKCCLKRSQLVLRRENPILEVLYHVSSVAYLSSMSIFA